MEIKGGFRSHAVTFLTTGLQSFVTIYNEIKMNSQRKISTVAGLLFILAIIAGILSVVPVADGPDYLSEIANSETQLYVGAFFQFLMAAIYVVFATVLYPILREGSRGLARGFVTFRIFAAFFHIVGVILLIMLLTLCQEFLKAGSPESSHFQATGTFLRECRDFNNHVSMIISLSIGSLMFYTVLYRTKLIPRWLSGWGYAGSILTIFASLLIMFRLTDIMTATYLIMNLPMALNEIVLAIWLIVKGFNQSAINSLSAKQL